MFTLILTKKQRFGRHIKNQNYYFYNGQINLEDFDSSLIKVGKKNYKEIDIYYIGYVT